MARQVSNVFFTHRQVSLYCKKLHNQRRKRLLRSLRRQPTAAQNRLPVGRSDKIGIIWPSTGQELHKQALLTYNQTLLPSKLLQEKALAAGNKNFALNSVAE